MIPAYSPSKDGGRILPRNVSLYFSSFSKYDSKKPWQDFSFWDLS